MFPVGGSHVRLTELVLTAETTRFCTVLGTVETQTHLYNHSKIYCKPNCGVTF